MVLTKWTDAPFSPARWLNRWKNTLKEGLEPYLKTRLLFKKKEKKSGLDNTMESGSG